MDTRTLSVKDIKSIYCNNLSTIQGRSAWKVYTNIPKIKWVSTVSIFGEKIENLLPNSRLLLTSARHRRVEGKPPISYNMNKMETS